MCDLIGRQIRRCWVKRIPPDIYIKLPWQRFFKIFEVLPNYNQTYKLCILFKFLHWFGMKSNISSFDLILALILNSNLICNYVPARSSSHPFLCWCDSCYSMICWVGFHSTIITEGADAKFAVWVQQISSFMYCVFITALWRHRVVTFWDNWVMSCLCWSPTRLNNL